MGLFAGSATKGGVVSYSGAWRLGVSSALIALMSVSLVVPATAESKVSVPRGFEIMCIDHPSECRGGGASQVEYTPKLAALLDKVNSRVNRSISPVKNEVIDVWSVNVSRGDCEDYVLAKRRALISAGIPASALSIVYALRNGGGHAILAVHTDAGSYALDNMTGKVKPLWSTGYKLVSMSGPNPRVWQRVPRALYAKK
jgi:predicted transglutaminase-like cysteine proteinase